MTPTPLLLTGPPGTGKSTLAEHAATVLHAPVLGWDWAMAAITGFESITTELRRLPHVEYRRVDWSILWNLATAQLRHDRNVVLDGVARDIEISATRDLARTAGATSLVVVTSCHDRDAHQARVQGRARNIPGWHELDWNYVATFLDRWEPPTDADLHLDAINPLEANQRLLTDLLANETPRQG